MSGKPFEVWQRELGDAAVEGPDRGAGTWWSQVKDVRIETFVTGYLLPLLACPCCGKVNAAELPPWAFPGSVSCDGASERLSGRLQDAGFDEAMQAALENEPRLAAGETPVNLLEPAAGLAGDETGAPHVLVICTPHAGLTWLRALGSRQHAAITAILAFFTGFLISDGYGAYQELLPQVAGIQQCCQHVIRRCRAVTRLGPGGLQSWAGDVIEILREAHQAVGDALARGDPAVDAQLLAKLRARYDEAVAFGITHNRHRDWHDGNHPGCALGTPSAAGCASTRSRSGLAQKR